MSFLLQNCSESVSTDNDKIYRGKFTDHINVVNHSDTVNIIFKQKRVEYNQKEEIPFRIIGSKKDSLIKLNLFGHYETYIENPQAVKEIENTKDTLIIGYYFYNKYDKILKSNNFNYVNNSSEPILQYMKVDSIIVEKDFNKVLNLKSKFIN